MLGHVTRAAGISLVALSLVLIISCSDSSSRHTAATTTAPAQSGTTTTTTSSGTAPATSASRAPGLPALRPNGGAQVVDRVGEGWLELKAGRKVVHVKGTPRERGFQYGYLLGDEIQGVFQRLYAYVQSQAPNIPTFALQLLSPAGAFAYRPFFTQETLDEIDGIVDGMKAKNPAATITADDLVFVNALIDVGATVDLQVFKCSSLAVWGPISQGGKVYQTRVVDLTIGTGLEHHAVIAYVKPEGGTPYCNPGWAGMIGCASGLSARGIGVGQVWAFSQDRQLGRPWALATRELLANGRGVEDAVTIFRRDVRTYGSNFVFADRGDFRGGAPRGLAIESTARALEVFESNDPREDLALWNGQPYGIRIPNAVFRGDCALDPGIRARQTASNGPSGDPRTASAYKNRYKGQADRILAYINAGTPIGKDECIEITKQVTMPNNSLQCCVYENSDLELWIANARIDAQGNLIPAFQEPYEHHSLDYYTPTLSLVPDHTAITLGSTQRLAFPISTLGRARGLEIEVRLETASGSHTLGTVQSVHLTERGGVTPTLTVTIPAGATAGPATLVADLREAGTTDLVDCARTAITLSP